MENKDLSVSVLRANLEADHMKTLAIIDQHGALVGRVVKAMPKGSVMRLSADTVSFNISTSGDKHALAGVIRALRINGFSTTNKPPGKNDSSWSAFFYKDGICLYLTFSSSACRRVKVGTKMVEQDIYETVCDEITFPEAASA